MISQETQDALSRPFDLTEVRFLPKTVKGNRALAMPYVTARAVQDRLDAVLGVGGWQDDYVLLQDGSVMCQLKVRAGDQWVMKVDVGGMSEQPDAGDRLKAAFSDALKRTAVKFGVGRYLYRLPAVWHDYDPQRKQFNGTPQLPEWAIPKRGPHPQQQRPPAQTATTQTQPAQPTPAGGSGGLDGAVKAVAESKTPVELEAAVFAGRAVGQKDGWDVAAKTRFIDAVQSKILRLVQDCQSGQQLDAVWQTYQKVAQPVMNEQRQAAVQEAFDAKDAQLNPGQSPQQPADDVPADPYD